MSDGIGLGLILCIYINSVALIRSIGRTRNIGINRIEKNVQIAELSLDAGILQTIAR